MSGRDVGAKRFLSTRKGQAVVGGALVLGCLFFLNRGMRLNSAEASRNVMLDLLDGRGGAVYRLATPEERQHITEEQWRRVYASLIQPRLDRYPTDRKFVLDASGEGGSWGNAVLWFEDGKKEKFPTAVTVWMTEKGETGPMLMSCLALAWRLERFGANGPDFRNDGLAHAYLNGLRKDRAAMEAVGLKGIYMSPQEGFLTWDQLDARWATRVAAAAGTGA
jgi:hypothetical protein